MTQLVVPLYFRAKPRKRARVPLGKEYGLTLQNAEGSVLLTRENFTSLLDEIGDRGLPRFHLFETRMEARAAQLLYANEERRLRGLTGETGIGTLRDGEGVLVIFHRDRPVSGDGFELTDHRLVRDREIVGSWDLPEEACREAMSAPAGINRNDLAIAVAAKLSALPAELLRDLQIALGRVPGAYTGFVSVSPEDVRRDHRLEGADPERLTDKLIQPFLDRASAKAELGEALSEAIDATVVRLLAAHPELRADEDESPEP